MSSHLTAIAMVLGLSAAGFAQKPDQETPQKPAPKPVPAETTAPTKTASASPMISIASLRGADVAFESATPGKGDPAGGKDGTNTPKARLADLVLSTRDGRLSYAVVAVSGGAAGKDKTVLVPAADLKLAMMDEKAMASVKMSGVQLQGQPVFDLEKAKREGVDAALAEGKPPMPGDKGKGEGKPEGKGEKAEGPNPSADAVPKLALSSQLGTWAVQASDRPFGTVKDGALDTEKNTIAYLFAAPSGGGDTIVIPFAACTCARADQNTVLKVAKTTEQLGTAPKYEKPAQGLLTTDQMKRAEEFFGTRGAVGSQG